MPVTIATPAPRRSLTPRKTSRQQLSNLVAYWLLKLLLGQGFWKQLPGYPKVSPPDVLAVLATALDLSHPVARKALAADGHLARSGLLRRGLVVPIKSCSGNLGVNRLSASAIRLAAHWAVLT